MKFSKKKYLVLNDVGDDDVLMSQSAILALEKARENEMIDINGTFSAFYKKVINKCKRGYYLSSQINEVISNDIKIQNKLGDLLHELEPTDGILLLPKNGAFSIFNSIAYLIGKDDKYPDELGFSIAFYSERGIETFISGVFIGKKFKSISFEASDIMYYQEPNEVREKLINYVLNIILFMQFAEIETIIVIEKNNTSGKRNKVKFNKENYLNESPIPIEIIDSTWFRKLIRIGAFKVSGHFRLQPYGKGNLKRKLIWINEYEKQSYIQNPKISKKNRL